MVVEMAMVEVQAEAPRISEQLQVQEVQRWHLVLLSPPAVVAEVPQAVRAQRVATEGLRLLAAMVETDVSGKEVELEHRKLRGESQLSLAAVDPWVRVAPAKIPIEEVEAVAAVCMAVRVVRKAGEVEVDPAA